MALRLRKSSSKLAIFILFLFFFVIGSIALVIIDQKGFPDRMPNSFNLILSESTNVNPNNDKCQGDPAKSNFPWCVLGGSDIKAVIVGDSHASAIALAVKDSVAKDPSQGVIQATYTSCQTLFNIKKTDPSLRCKEFNQFVLRKLNELPPTIPLVIANRLSSGIFGSHLKSDKSFGIPSIYFGGRPLSGVTDSYLNDVRNEIISSACKSSEARSVYWLKPIPEMLVDVPHSMARRFLIWGDLREVGLPLKEYVKRNNFVNSALDEAAMMCGNFNVLNPVPSLRNDEECFGSYDGKPLYYDDTHLSEWGNRRLIPLFKRALFLDE